MPTYEYRCARCEEQIEVYQSFTDAPLTKHAGCGGKLTKVLSPAGIVLKGSGFYKIDNRGGKSSSGGSSRSESSSTSSTSASGSSGDSAGSGSDAKTSSDSASTKLAKSAKKSGGSAAKSD